MEKETASLILAAIADFPRPLPPQAARLWWLAELQLGDALPSQAEWARRWGWDRKKVREFLSEFLSDLSTLPVAAAAPLQAKSNIIDDQVMEWALMDVSRRIARGERIENSRRYAQGTARRIRAKGGLAEEQKAELAQPQPQPQTVSPRQSDADRLRQRLPPAAEPAVAAKELKNIMNKLCPATHH